MNIRYIYGNTGSGKSTLCIDEIYEKSKNKKNNVIYIVPEQFTLQSEKKLIEKFPSGVLLNIYILSFKRLAHTLFSETGLSSAKILGDVGKLMLIRKIAYENSKNLSYFKNSIDKDGFLENISKTISEFFQYNVSPQTLEKISEKLNKKPNLCEKMKDVSLIYKEYINYLSKEYISTDETLDLLSNKIKDSNLIKNSEIWIDEFNGFTPQELKVIKELFKYAKQINITFCSDSEKTDFKNLNSYDCFYETKNTINKLNTFVREANVVFLPHTFLKENIRQRKSSELTHLNQNYLSYKKEEYKKEINDIKIFRTKNKYSEVAMAASNILSLVRENGYNYRDIAVILGNSEYESVIQSTFSQYNIPYFIDSKKDITTNRVAELISSFFEIFTTNWSYEAVFRFLKTYLTPLEPLDVSILENYVLECGIKGKRWFLPKWEYGFANSNFNEDDINYLKDCFMECLEPFTNHIKPNKKYTVKEISFRLYNFLTELKLEEILDYSKSPECFQVYGTIMELLDKIIEIFGEQKVTLSEYSKILNSGIKACKTGSLPQTQDEVIVGDLKRTRLSKIKALLILSVNDGIIPSIPNDDGIFSDDDKDVLNANNLELSPTSFFQMNQDNFLLYKMFSQPMEKLYLSYITESLDGKEKRLSKVILTIKKLFPKLCEKSDKISAIEKITLPFPSFTELTIPLEQYSKGKELEDIYKDLYIFFSKERYFKEKLNIIEKNLFIKDYEDNLSEEAVFKLYGKEINSSVSQLEQYASCPFSYFMEYGLKANERKIYEITVPEIGSVFHRILEEFSKYLKNNNIKWDTITDEQIKEIIGYSLDNMLTETKNKIFTSSAKYKFMLNSIKTTSIHSLKIISEHIKSGKFSPLGFEIGFGKKYKLPAIIIELKNNAKLILTGKIDRIDILDKDGQSYVKIIDYKTGEKKFDLSEIYYGLQLQLLIYLDAFIKKGKKLVGENIFPAGVFYFKIHEPTINLKDNYTITPEKLKNEILKDFKMSGLALKDTALIQMIDNVEKGHSNIFSMFISSNEKVSDKLSSVASLEEFDALREYVLSLAEKYGNEIYHGNIKVYPYKKYNKKENEKETSCEYCKFSPICQFEINERKDNIRKLKQISNPLEKIIEYNNKN